LYPNGQGLRLKACIGGHKNRARDAAPDADHKAMIFLAQRPLFSSTSHFGLMAGHHPLPTAYFPRTMGGWQEMVAGHQAKM